MASNSGSEGGEQRRRATVYDAVAGRVGYEGFLGQARSSGHGNVATSGSTAVPADEVLFRRRGAPLRYEEDDIYSADRHLTSAQRLPDSDLLKTIHAYVSDFYASHSRDSTGKDSETSFRSMDETALLAIGILLEEAAREVIGENGDLALYKAADDGHDRVPERRPDVQRPGSRSKRKRARS